MLFDRGQLGKVENDHINLQKATASCSDTHPLGFNDNKLPVGLKN